MTDFSQFNTCEKHGFCDRNAPNDADIVKTYSVWKNTDFYSSRANLPFYPNIVPAPAFSAAFSRSFLSEVLAEYPIQTVIQLLSTSGF